MEVDAAQLPVGEQIVKLEMRRGAIVLAVLSRLKTEQYGYSLIWAEV